MTQEEKAKAYDEALEQAQKELATCGSMDCDAAKQIFRFFPQFRYSEDERIRKELIEFLDGVWHLGKNANFDKWSKADCAKWIAWLKAGFHKGKEEALKGMPKWKKADGEKKYPSHIIREKDGNGDYWYRLSVGKIYDGYEYILVSELEKLPHE